jgi:hypothetical protein
MFTLISLAIDLTATALIGVLKLGYYGARYAMYGKEKTIEEEHAEELNSKLNLMSNKLDRLSKEVKEEKKLKESITLRQSI